MNSTFKVVFNKARGALMVVNEVTSSVQGKGTKTVVAAAVAALISGSAMAAELSWEDVAKKTDWTYDNIAADGSVEKPSGLVINTTDLLKEGETLKLVGYEADSTINGLHNNDKNTTNKGVIYVEATDIKETGLVGMTSGYLNKLTSTNDGQIYVKAKNSVQVSGMGAVQGDTIVNNGLIKTEGENTFGVITWKDQDTEGTTTINNAGTIDVTGKNA